MAESGAAGCGATAVELSRLESAVVPFAPSSPQDVQAIQTMIAKVDRAR
jgi:hypothetical protein